MTPEQVSLINAISAILDKIGTMPIMSLVVLIIIGPWIMAWIISRGQEKRFEAVSKMYENNVDLVKGYAKIAENQQDLVIANIQTMTKVQETADKNLFCPIVRQRTKQREAGE